ncbi:HAD family hydrolase [Mycoplasma iguanae]|uniref:HAD family hydrolase n=1 Tax=Mycoplasma iguanae TaxID=292461 RepID=A0ABY5R8C1_9MOLU|nr:HAD family hydrolase [Mycoplasma iguanae]UVD81526.1 HAD family hydrolase [Mycoplasma iguanae]
MNNKILVFSDVDGTLYGDNFIVKHQTIKHIHQLSEKYNVELIIATGNPPFSRHQKLADDLKVRYLITSNGSTIFDNVEKKYLFKKTFSLEQQKQVIAAAKNFNLQLNFWNHQDYFSLNHKEEFIKSWIYSMEDTSKVLLNVDQPQEEVVKMELFGEKTDIDQAYKFLENSKLQIVRMREKHLEITQQDVSKGSAISWFITNIILNSVDNIMVIGDSPNDWSMFETTKYSYAMANANKETKLKAKYHTSAHDQNGVGEAIVDFLYRSRNIKPSK